MNSTPHFVWDYLPFWVVNYGLAVVMWSCIARFLLGFFAFRLQTNYIWRAFVGLTQWAVTATAWVTPRYIHPILLPPIAALWLFYLRIAVFLAMWNAGMTPSIAPPAAG
ncbi:MAG: hypothetical protein FJX46_08350 [Alphaproteobacteria bacterium]|nr:hypothetical protein [Alphaproteobacteria bacterium]